MWLVQDQEILKELAMMISSQEFGVTSPKLTSQIFPKVISQHQFTLFISLHPSPPQVKIPRRNFTLHGVAVPKVPLPFVPTAMPCL